MSDLTKPKTQHGTVQFLSFHNHNIMFVTDHFKKNILDRVGGKAQYDMTVFDLSERLKEDPALAELFHNMDIDSVCQLQHEMLTVALVELDARAKMKLLRTASLHHYRLFQIGMGDEHFGIIAMHLKEALRESWVDEDVIEDVLSYYNELRKELFTDGSIAEKSAPTQQRRPGARRVTRRDSLE